MRKIGPHISRSYGEKLTMQDAYAADNERGSHELNNLASEKLDQEWPTVMAMSGLIEKERDELLSALKDAIAQLDNYTDLDSALERDVVGYKDLVNAVDEGKELS